MTVRRVLTGIAVVLTVLVLQATLIAPLTLPVPVSLPAVLIAAIALAEGPGSGITLGFSLGLLADLASRHPAGTFALVWMALGLGCGLLAEPGAVRYFSVRVHAALAGFSAAAASLAATVVLAVLRADGAEPSTVVHQLVPTVLGDLLLALALVPLVRLFLRSRGLRKPGPPVLDLTASLR